MADVRNVFFDPCFKRPTSLANVKGLLSYASLAAYDIDDVGSCAVKSPTDGEIGFRTRYPVVIVEVWTGSTVSFVAWDCAWRGGMLVRLFFQFGFY